MFAYQLAVSQDDGAMGITHVFRGNDLMDSTFYQILLMRKMGYTPPAYAHLPLLVDQQGIRLSKRQHGISVKELRESGTTAEEIIGFLLYLAGKPVTSAGCLLLRLFGMSILTPAEISQKIQ